MLRRIVDAAERIEAMLFRAGGSPPRAAFCAVKDATLHESDARVAEKMRGARGVATAAGAETIAAGVVFALLLIAWKESGFPAPPHPWGDFVIGHDDGRFRLV